MMTKIGKKHIQKETYENLVGRAASTIYWEELDETYSEVELFVSVTCIDDK